MAEHNLVALMSRRAPPPERVYRRGRVVCRYCGGALTATTRARGACASPECRKKDRSLRDRIRRERDEIEMAAMRAAAARAVAEEEILVERLRSDAQRELTGIDPSSPALEIEHIAATCHTSSPLVDMAPDDVENFRARMLKMLRDIFEQQDGERAKGIEPDIEDDGVLVDNEEVRVAALDIRTYDERKVMEQPAHPAENAACAACRGRCCEAGDQNLAYIRPVDVARFRQRQPDATPETMTEAYCAYVPDRRAQHSCPYHGEKGCTLPREMRSNICNGYKCFWLLNIGELVKAGEAPRVVAGFQNHRPRRAFLVGEDGELTELTVDSSISSADLIAESARVARQAKGASGADQTLSPDPGFGGSAEAPMGASAGASAGGTGS